VHLFTSVIFFIVGRPSCCVVVSFMFIVEPYFVVYV
jgi:hypothetical protein